MLALFWETSWGRSAAHCEADQYARIHYMRAMALELKVKSLEQQILHLQAVLDKNTSGAANAPIFDVR